MGAAIQSLGDAGKILRHNPVIFLVGGIAWFVFGVVSFVLGLIPLIGPVLTFFLMPLFVAGILSVIYAGRDGTASFGDFVDGVGDSYLQMLGAFTLIAIPSFVLSIAFFVIVFFFLSVSPARPEAVGGVGLLAWLGFMVLVGVGYLLFQFFDIAIVAGSSVLESFRTSMAVVLDAPLSAFGFTLVQSLIGSLILGTPNYIVFSVASADAVVTSPRAAGLTILAVMLGYIFVAAPLWVVVSRTYHVAYFNRRQAQRA